jgi:hypothetical protein
LAGTTFTIFLGFKTPDGNARRTAHGKSASHKSKTHKSLSFGGGGLAFRNEMHHAT